jgi:hypothetical protein
MPARTKTISLTACLGLLIASGTAHPAEWSLTPNITTSGGYIDDYLLNDAATTPSANYGLSAGTAYSVESERWRLAGNAKIGATRYSANEIKDRDTWRIDTGYNYQTELSHYTIDALTQRDTTYDTELDETGVVTANSERTNNSVSPAWSRQLGQKTSIQASANITDVSYKDTQDTASVSRDYVQRSATLGITRMLNERTRINGGLSYSDYKTDDNLVDYKIRVLNLGASRTFSETFNGSISIGVRESNTARKFDCVELFGICIFTPPTQHSSGRGYNFSLGLNKSFESGGASLSLRRDSRATATEGVVQTTQLNLSLHYRFTEKLTGTIVASSSATQGLDDSLSTSVKNYLSFHPSLGYQLTKQWMISGEYRHRELKTEAEGTDKSNAVYLTLAYTWPKMAVSR